jgi:hypothetical protein
MDSGGMLQSSGVTAQYVSSNLSLIGKSRHIASLRLRILQLKY